MDAATRQFVRRRAVNRCEYCLIPQEATPFIPFHVEHVVPRQHLHDDRVENLALACDRCNAFKGTNLTSIDPNSEKLVPLFNPRQDQWEEHFRFAGGEIIGSTATGRATVRLLNMNALRRVELREEWLEAGEELT
jgi:5-methylcytosine-specific restriction endonuclease McrA